MNRQQEEKFWNYFYIVLAAILIVVFWDLWAELFGMWFGMCSG